jgi:hypothetical protein
MVKMQGFRSEAVRLNGNTARFGAVGSTYRVILTVERIDGKTITELGLDMSTQRL